jgi:type II secretory pathway component PulF
VIKKPRGAIIGAATILVLATSVCTILVVFVLPNFVGIFAESHTELPLPARIVLGVGVLVSTWRIAILVVLLAILGVVAFPRGGGR